MTSEQLVEKVRQSQAQWKELRDRWSELKLPGSSYMPNEFLAALLLSQVSGDSKEVAARVRAGHDHLRNLQEQGVFGNLSSDTDRMVIIALVLAEQSVSLPAAALPEPSPREAPEVIHGPCQHCGHDHAKCVAGEYAVDPAPAAEPVSVPQSVVAVHLPSLTQSAVDRCSNCGHRFECCVEGHYGLEPFAHALVHGVKPAGCEHVGFDGKCVDCTDDDTTQCSGCDKEVVKTKAAKCKDKDCDQYYCEECKGELSEYGYCSNCSTLTCDGCGDEIDSGTEKICARPKCREGKDFCDECAARLLTAQGLCSTCAKEKTIACDECGTECVASRLAKCLGGDNCELLYCPDCKNGALDEAGLCTLCR